MNTSQSTVQSYLLLLVLISGLWKCTRPEPEINEPIETYPVSAWITSPDKVNLLYEKTLPFSSAEDSRFATVSIDTSLRYQSMDGFGFTLTGGSAQLIQQMEPNARAALLEELFGNAKNAIRISFLRISIGASDLDPEIFSYDDRPSGSSDFELAHFSLSRDTMYLIPLLKQILQINPSIQLMASPWSAPAWMKDNGQSKGGALRPVCYPVYARYLLRYIQAMAEKGIPIGSMTIQNEPLHGGNNPSMLMTAIQQADFVKNHLGPTFESAGQKTKLIIWDHNCDRPEYPISILNDPEAKKYIDGSAFHLYGGDIQAMSQVKQAHPDKNLYFTEQWTGANGVFGEDLKWHIRHVVIGAARNWSRVILEWNLANDPGYSLHTPGGCSECLGAVTIDRSGVQRNVSYYIIAHAARFVPPGSVRLESTIPTNLPNVAFITPEGKKVLLVLNDSANTATFNVHTGAKKFIATLNPGNVGTFLWE